MADEVAEHEDLQERGESLAHPMWRLFRDYGWDHVGWFAVGVVTSSLARFARMVPPIVLGAAIDSVLRADGTPYALPFVPASWLPATEDGQFWFSAALMGGAMVVWAACNFARQSSLNLFSHRVKHEVRVASYQQMQRLDMGFFDDKQTGELMSILSNDANRLELFLDNMMGSAIQLIVLMVGIMGVLLWMNWQLALVTAIAIPLAAAFTYGFMQFVEERYEGVREAVGDLNTRLENNLAGIDVIKTSATEEYEDERIRKTSYAYFMQDWKALRANFIYRPGMQILTAFAFVATFVLGGLWVRGNPPLFFSGTLTVGTLVTFLLLTQQLVNPLTQMSEVVDRYEDAKASTGRILGLMEVPVDITDREDAVPLEDPEGHVEYDDVSFAYREGGETVLEDIDFEVEPGETVGLVGPTGAGKTSILKLLVRLYDVSEGELRVDGRDVREYTLESLRDTVGYVGQEDFMFDGTVAENIRYGSFDASEEAVREAARKAQAHEFVQNLQNGYDTQVGERGVKLSGGQRQRLALARTILAEPAILVLDEATSNVDTETEMLIQRALDDLAADRTTFAIAHRLSTVRDADTILVVEDGRIVERGTHGELLDEDGLYANLWRVQAGELEELPEEFVREAQERASAARN